MRNTESLFVSKRLIAPLYDLVRLRRIHAATEFSAVARVSHSPQFEQVAGQIVICKLVVGGLNRYGSFMRRRITFAGLMFLLLVQPMLAMGGSCGAHEQQVAATMSSEHCAGDSHGASAALPMAQPALSHDVCPDSADPTNHADCGADCASCAAAMGCLPAEREAGFFAANSVVVRLPSGVLPPVASATPYRPPIRH